MDFAYLTPDRVLTVVNYGKKSKELHLNQLTKKQCAALAAVLNSDRYQKSVELDDRDLTPTVYFFRVKPFIIPPEFMTDHPVILHDFVPSVSLPASVEEN